MNAIFVSTLVFASVFVGAIVGLIGGRCLPAHHLSSESKDVVKVGAGLIGTMAALLLGLLVASAKDSYDTKRGELIQMAAKVTFLDRLLAHYGTDAVESRDLLRRSLERAIEEMWPHEASKSAQFDPSTAGGEAIFETLHKLSPHNDEQSNIKTQALSLATDIGQTRWLLLAQKDSAILTPMLVIVVFWLTIVFLSFGLFTTPNATVYVTLLLCALSVAGAIFLILELDQPFRGLIHIPSTPLRNALEHLGR